MIKKYNLFIIFFMIFSFINVNYFIIYNVNLSVYILLIIPFFLGILHFRTIKLKFIFLFLIFLFSSLINSSVKIFFFEFFQLIFIIYSLSFIVKKINNIAFFSLLFSYFGIFNSICLLLFFFYKGNLDPIYNLDYKNFYLFSSIYLTVFSLFYNLLASHKKINFIFCIVNLSAIIIYSSRSILLSLFFVIIYVFLISKYKYLIYKFFIFTAIAFLLFNNYILDYNFLYKYKFDYFINFFNNYSILIRTEQYKYAADTILSNPLFGIGLGNNFIFIDFKNYEIHNLLLNLLLSFGIPSVIIFVYCCKDFLISLLKINNFKNIDLISFKLTILLMLISSFFLIINNSLNYIFLIFFILIYNQYRDKNNFLK